MFTDEQRELFSKILDVNQAFQAETEYFKKHRLHVELDMLQTELRESMGSEKYYKFMNMGREMFAPKED